MKKYVTFIIALLLVVSPVMVRADEDISDTTSTTSTTSTTTTEDNPQTGTKEQLIVGCAIVGIAACALVIKLSKKKTVIAKI